MIGNGLKAFAGKKVLLLQGPIGPFFSRFAHDLMKVGAEVHKVNFNGGDWLFYPWNAIGYHGSMREWPAFFRKLVTRYSIDTVFLFGDCRPVHSSIRQLCRECDIQVGVFEEGYVRPDYITLEEVGTNGYSRIPREAAWYLQAEIEPPPPTRKVGNTYWWMALWASLYYVAGSLLKPLYPRYIHHRPLTLKEAVYWIRSAWRKWLYAYRERGIEAELTGRHSGNYFLIPLQVHTDSQVRVHSEVDSVEEFIEKVVTSFATHAPADTLLVLKHHPMDRGYHDYTSLLRDLGTKFKLGHRLLYIHDQHLPTLLDHARGVVVINSTVGLSALHHQIPLKVCGSAVYNIDGLTFQGSLDEFWNKAATLKVDKRLYTRFRNHLITKTQLNGSFYSKLITSSLGAGLVWSKEDRDAVTTTSVTKQYSSVISRSISSIKSVNRLLLYTVILPTLFSAIYFGFIKSDIFVSEAHFVIRTPQKQSVSGLDAFLQGTGFSSSQDDTHTVHDFMLSRDALLEIEKQVDFRSAYSQSGIDPSSRFNALGFDDSFEALFRYYQRHVEVFQNASSAISTLKVRAYTPDDAYRINELLLDMGEELINQLNDRGRNDLIRHAQVEVDLAAEKATNAAVALSVFRNSNGLVDPLQQSAIQLQQISKLQDEQLAARTRLEQMYAFTPESPQIPALEKQLEAVEHEMNSELSKVAGSEPSLTNKAVEYERLALELSFAEQQLAAAMATLEQARSDAERQQLYLERIVQPNRPDVAIEPKRARAVLTTFLVGLIVWGILSMLIAGVREHHD
ncbi:capsular polysaccharide export protein, LipB/KpsS family [Prosthecochloris vibrioformis]|uniref:Capsular biosynthesis protein n=1 Tax=Prosthecochloris vibrioformis TaxID=1098 RepID=A0A5C4RY65_PROVB|nr:hypothetical protein [Prosthecochloris vibrioformis]TNJ35955.1 hypothetical protein FGF68_09800 [Prosthecochloris vibrioformis]